MCTTAHVLPKHTKFPTCVSPSKLSDETVSTPIKEEEDWSSNTNYNTPKMIEEGGSSEFSDESKSDAYSSVYSDAPRSLSYKTASKYSDGSPRSSQASNTIDLEFSHSSPRMSGRSSGRSSRYSEATSDYDYLERSSDNLKTAIGTDNSYLPTQKEQEPKEYNEYECAL